MKTGRIGIAIGVGLIAATVVLLLLPRVVPPPAEGRHRGPGDAPNDFRQLLPRDAIRPVYRPEFVPAAEATLEPDELVLGVEIEGRARAYPLGFLNFREMVNDRIGPVSFLVTW